LNDRALFLLMASVFMLGRGIKRERE